LSARKDTANGARKGRIVGSKGSGDKRGVKRKLERSVRARRDLQGVLERFCLWPRKGRLLCGKTGQARMKKKERKVKAALS